MSVAAFLIGLWVGADDGMMAALMRVYADGVDYSSVSIYHTLPQNIICSIFWGFIFSLIVAITYWLNYEDLDGSSLTGVKISISWSIGYGLSSMAIYGISNGLIIGVSSVVCLILLAIMVDVSIKMAIGKRRQGRSSIKTG